MRTHALLGRHPRRRVFVLTAAAVVSPAGAPLHTSTSGNSGPSY